MIDDGQYQDDPPPGLPRSVRGVCGKHGEVSFDWLAFGAWWVCEKFFDQCGYVVLPEHITPDGADPVDYGSHFKSKVPSVPS